MVFGILIKHESLYIAKEGDSSVKNYSMAEVCIALILPDLLFWIIPATKRSSFFKLVEL